MEARQEEEYTRPAIHPFETHHAPSADFVPENNGAGDGTVDQAGDATGPIELRIGQTFRTEAIDSSYDVDYFQVELEAGRTYVMHVRGASTGDGRLENPMMFGMWKHNEATGGADKLTGTYQGHDNGDGTNGFITFTPSETGHYYFGVNAENWGLSTSLGTYSVEIYDMSADVGATIATAQEIPLVDQGDLTLRSELVAGQIENSGDVDRFSFTVVEDYANDPLLISLHSDSLSGASLTLCDASGDEVEQYDVHDVPGESTHIVFIPPAVGVYYVDGTTDVSDDGTRDVGSYEIEIMHTHGQYLTAEHGGLIHGNGLADIIFASNDVDEVSPGPGGDVVYGQGGDDLVFGSLGGDRLYGNAGEDTLIGNRGNDLLYGGDDADLLRGGAGDDVLDGGAGNDTLVDLGGGADTFHFSLPANDDGALGRFGDDTVRGFRLGEDDRLDVDELLDAYEHLQMILEVVANPDKPDDAKMTFMSSAAPNATELGSITIEDFESSLTVADTTRSSDDSDYDPAEHYGLPENLAQMFTFYHEEEAQDSL